MKHVLMVCVTALFPMLPYQANAVSLPPILPDIYESGDNSAVTFPGPCCAHVLGPNTTQTTPGAVASNTIDLSAAPSISSSSSAHLVNVSPDASVSSTAQSTAVLEYYAEIVAPIETIVPVLVQAQGHANAMATSGPLDADAGINFTIAPNASLANPYLEEGLTTTMQNTAPSFYVNQTVNLPTNTPIFISLFAESKARVSKAFFEVADMGYKSAYADIDPYFQLDPKYVGYSLVFSSGISNTLVSSVPLPASAPMLGASLIGLGLLGFAERTRRLLV